MHQAATFAEIETELDERLAGLQARLLEDVASASSRRRARLTYSSEHMLYAP